MPGDLSSGSLEKAPDNATNPPQWTLADSWIWARCQELIRDVDRFFLNHQYGEAGRQIYDFFWGEFADWYLEIAKKQINEGGDRAFYTARTLTRIIDISLRLLHPFTPFITEEIWGHLKTACQEKSNLFSPQEGWADALMIAKWPKAQNAEGWEDEKIKTFTLIQEIVRGIRNVRTEKKLPPSKKIAAIIAAGNQSQTLIDQKTTIAILSGLDLNRFEIHEYLPEKPVDSTPIVISGVDIYLSLSELVDNEAEIARLTKELQEIKIQIDRLEQLLGSSFAEKAPPQVIAKEKEKLSNYKNSAEKLIVQINLLK